MLWKSLLRKSHDDVLLAWVHTSSVWHLIWVASHVNVFPLICIPVTPNEQMWVTSCLEEKIWLPCYSKFEKCLEFSAKTVHLLQILNKQLRNWVSWNNFFLFYCCVLLMLLLPVFSLKLLFPSFTGFFFPFLKAPLNSPLPFRSCLEIPV